MVQVLRRNKGITGENTQRPIWTDAKTFIDGDVEQPGHVRNRKWAATRELSAHEGAVLLLHCLQYAASAKEEIRQEVAQVIDACGDDNTDATLQLSQSDVEYLKSFLDDATAVNEELDAGMMYPMSLYTCQSIN